VTGKLITSVAAGSKKDVDLAVEAAKKVRDRIDDRTISIY